MKNLFAVAKEFSENLPRTKLAAGRKSRKQLEKDLATAKERYHKFRSSLEDHERAQNDLNQIVDKERKNVDSQRKEILRCYDILRTMDINNISEVRLHNNGDVGYVKNNRLFRLEDEELVPYRRKSSEEESDDLESTESSQDIDDLLNTLM